MEGVEVIRARVCTPTYNGFCSGIAVIGPFIGRGIGIFYYYLEKKKISCDLQMKRSTAQKQVYN